MLELNVEIDIEKFKSEGFRAVRKIDGVERFPGNTWLYENVKSNEIYFVVELGRSRVRPIESHNIRTGKTESSIESGEEDYA